MVGGEYCGQNEPAMRSFEPLFADNRASECGGKSHWFSRLNTQPLKHFWSIPMAAGSI